MSLDLPSQARALGDAPAVIMGGGQLMSYRELDAGFQPARSLPARCEGLTPGRSHRDPHGEQPPVPRDRMGRSALRPVLHGREQPPPPERGAVHPRRLRREGDLVTSAIAAAAVGSSDLSRAARSRLCVGGELEGSRPTRIAIASQPSSPDRRRVRGPRDALLVGDHREAEGGPEAAAAHASGRHVRGPCAHRVSDGAVGCRAGGGLPVAGAALPLGAARLLDVDAPPRRHGRGHGALRRPGVPRADREASGDARAVRPDDVHPASCASARASERSTTSRVSKYVVHAAAPCPVETKRQMLEWWGPIIHEYYGGTEDVGSTWITAEEWIAHPGSVGRPMEPAHIVGPDGTELPIGGEGIVYFEGGRPFEYHNNPDALASMTERGGWRTLGDIGRLDDDGYLYLTDRIADMIISGGVNIYPREAENVLAAHPLVADVAVLGVPDAEMGESVKAVVELRGPDLGRS